YFALRSDLSFEVLCEPSLMKVYVIKRRNKDYQIVLMICLYEFQNIVMLVLTILTCSVAEVTQFLPWYVSLTVGFSVLYYLRYLCTKKSLIIMIESSAHGDEYDGVMYSQLVSSVLCIVQLICTVTPASGSMEETHNTLKFASRAKQVEIYASRNRVNILFSIWLEMLCDSVRHKFTLQKIDILHEHSPVLESESTLNDVVASALSDSLDTLSDVKNQRYSSKLSEEHFPVSGSITDAKQVIELIVAVVSCCCGEASMVNASMVEMQQKKREKKKREKKREKPIPCMLLFPDSPARSNQKLAEEASYAKELASAAAVELKNLAGEVTKLSLQNERQAKELLAIQDLAAYSKTANGTICRFSESKNDGIKLGRKGRPPSRSGDAGNKGSDDMDNRNLDLGDVRMELQVRKQKEDTLEAALAEKVHLEKEYKKELEEAKKREISLENDLASMWVLVAKLKKGPLCTSELNADKSSTILVDVSDDLKMNNSEHNGSVHQESQAVDCLEKPNNEQLNQNQELEPLLVRLKATTHLFGKDLQSVQAKIQEMKEREFDSSGNGDTNSNVCKVCFESPTAAVLLPCRHFCCKHFRLHSAAISAVVLLCLGINGLFDIEPVCKPCSLACSECPLCRTKIADRIITFTS
ncbi:hypothetical protein B296_00028606, partial [Ensete ventricosum]